MAKNCKGCKHWRYLFEGYACHYAYDNAIAGKIGVTRDCPAEICDKYDNGKRNVPKAKSLKINNNGGMNMANPRYTAEQKQEMIKLHDEGESYEKISRKLNIPCSTVGKICSKEEPATAETVTSPNEIISEQIVTPTDEVVKLPELVVEAVKAKIDILVREVDNRVRLIDSITAECDEYVAQIKELESYMAGGAVNG